MFEEIQKLIKSKDKNLWSALYKKLESAGCIDKNYLEHTQNADIDESMKNVDSMSYEECCACLTWILRGERFCDGLFERHIRNGNVSALLKRIMEIRHA